MKLRFHKQFQKALQKLDKRKQEQARKKLHRFREEPYYASLRNHALRGKYLNYRSINISGDLRAIFQLSEDGFTATFVTIGSHSELYR